MLPAAKQNIIDAYHAYLSNKAFPCVAARAAAAKERLHVMVAGHMACPQTDAAILAFLYEFTDTCRNQPPGSFHSAVIIFEAPVIHSEEMFDGLMWQRLQSLSNLDARQYRYDARVDADPASANFSFSIKEEGFFIIGIHPQNSRPARRFQYPALVFNPHAAFVYLRETQRYEKMKDIVRNRDLALSGSVNPMLDDFGETSEVYQYSGKRYDPSWQCPLKINHGTTQHNPAP
jgi:hypothetical protein